MRTIYPRLSAAAAIASGLVATAVAAYVGAAPTAEASAPRAAAPTAPAAASGQPSAPSTSAGQRGETLRLVAKNGTVTSIDLGSKGFGPGDEYLLSDRLYRDGGPAGRDAGRCTVVTADGDAVCDVVLELPAGRIVVHGLLPATAHEFPLAVTGGTGRYSTARGQVLLRQGESSSTLTVTLAGG